MATMWEQPLDPSEQLDYEIDFTGLLEEGETIVAESWSAMPSAVAADAGLIVAQEGSYGAQLHDGSRIVLWLSIAEHKRAERHFSGAGRKLGVVVNFSTSSNPARRRQREFQVKVLRQ